MDLPPSFDAVLLLLVDRLAGVDAPWAITGSLGMRLQGMDLLPRDIDLQSDQSGTYRIQALLSEYVIQPVYFKASERIRSHFGAMEIQGVTVELMGDMEKLRPDGQWEPAPDLPAVTRRIEYKGMRLPVFKLSYECESYRLMGRAAKADLIRAFLEK